ncbi:NADP-specific glutamate dehydrogenase [Xanthovirga aplysinae]|uniref:NADP-specific glutamate dehydrogenase n=1 Tax=Xanthovirga aplysinae TaxID=2529853 RepID=UPI0012BCF786|nr:NADP-specific glutamate dehydrogenase [Xanthovirga aplysinae]MTI30334.1 NADP-specific glutamate dehydrogenase [Xanthovirga aplysinae]
MDLQSFMKGVTRRNPAEKEFHQAVKEVAEHVIPYINQHPIYEKARILERLTEPDRVVVFRVSWEDDQQNVRVNRGYRVQFSNAIGPYKGGLRFDKSVSLSILKFLGFEQTFKNSLTTLPMGGAKGGSDFNPKGKSNPEIMRFCQSYMTELQHHIGKDVDVPAGDIGVGEREISYLFGQYKRISGEFSGTLTGKGLSFGGSPIRKEATGYGCVYLAEEMLKRKDECLDDKICLISGSGNVAQHAAEKLIELGAKVVTFSDRNGFVHIPDGATQENLNYIIDLKTNQRGSLKTFAGEFGFTFYENEKPWKITCDLAFPCATQNELDKYDAQILLKHGCQLVCEGSNMPTTIEGVHLFEEAKILYAPSKAANAGGVAISGLEMTQNSIRITWSREEVDRHLKTIMHKIHEQCVEYGNKGNNHISYLKGANIGGFEKVAKALLSFGVV